MNNRTRVDMSNQTNIDKLQANAKKRLKIEQEFLQLLSSGNCIIELKNAEYGNEYLELASYINNVCDLPHYTKLMGWEIDSKYSELTDEGKVFFSLIKMLEIFVGRGWLKAEYLFDSEWSPENGLVNLHEKSQVFHPDAFWFSRALLKSSSNIARKWDLCEYTPASNKPDDIHNFHLLRYSLNERGFDAALALEKHNDEKSRFSQQYKLNKTSTQIAFGALVVGSLIAIGSLGNLALNLSNL